MKILIIGIAGFIVFHLSKKLMDFIEVVKRKLGKTSQKNIFLIQSGDDLSTYADVSDLGYKLVTFIEEGIDNFVDWYLEFFGVKP